MVKKNLYLIILFNLIILFLFLNFVSAAINWNNFGVFNGGTPPYASNGPGCKGGQNGGSFQSMSIGQGCGSENNPAYDLGAVWVDMDTNYIAWKIDSPNMTQSGICGGPKNSSNPGSSTGWAIAVEFDIDSNASTGCRMPNMACFQNCNGSQSCMNSCGKGDMCFPGSEYRFYVYGDNTTKFEMYNRSLSTCANEALGENLRTCFQMMTGINYTVNFTAICGTSPTTIKIAVNRSAIVGLSGMTFQTNTLGGGGNGPVDILGGFSSNSGGFQDNMMMGGPQDMMFQGQHPCFAITTQNNCTNISSNGNYSCMWDNFMSECKPNFMNMGSAGGMTCSQFCGACNSSATCIAGAKGKCMVVTAPSMMPPNAKNFTNVTGNYMCVEDMSKVMFGGQGSCDSDCKYCYSNSTCSNSAYPDPNGGSTGCKWVVDSVFLKSWCDLITFNETKLSCTRASLDRCFNSTGCTSVGGNWSSTSFFCYANFTGNDSQSDEICFDGNDNDGDNKIDCLDTDCSRESFCGGEINVLTGGFGTLDPVLAMQKQMFEDMDPSPPAMLFSDSVDNLVKIYDINAFMIKDMGKSLGMGIGVIQMFNESSSSSPENVSILCNGLGESKYYYFVDSDANSSSGCNATVGDTNYTGFEYRFEYEIKNNGSNSPLEIRRGFRCIGSNNFSLYPAKLASSPQIAELGNQKPTCMMDVAILAVDKADIGNPKGNIRFMAATSDNFTSYPKSNDTILGPSNAGIYYTPGAMDFRPTDCSQNPMACGTAFSVVGGGKFMPFEDCFPSSGDEDLDGLRNCDDPDCMMAPWCSGTDYITNDKTAPSVVSSKTESFNDFVFFHWTTNEPSNGTIKFYTSCSNNTAQYTVNDLGGPSTFDDYRPWHDFGLKHGNNDANSVPVTLTAGVIYYYRLNACDKAGNCGTSACLNFTTRLLAQQVQFKFDFAPNTTNALVNNTVMKLWNGTGYENIAANSTNNKSNYLQDAKLLFACNNSNNNWSIELEGVDLAQAVNFDLSSAFNISNDSQKTYVGMTNQKWLEMVQSLGADSVLITIPGTGTRLTKCNEANISDCSDVTSQATGGRPNATGDGWTKWKIPTSLGFSTYSLGNANYSLNFTNVTGTRSHNTTFINSNASFLINVSTTNNETNAWNLTVVTTGAAIGYVNGSSSFNVNISNTSSYVIRLNVTSANFETVNITIVATIANDSSIILNSSGELNMNATFLDNVAPVVHLVGPANKSFTNIRNFTCNVTDLNQSGISNVTLIVYNVTNVTLINITKEYGAGNYSVIASFITNLSNMTTNASNYTWTCLAKDFSNNNAWASEKNYTAAFDDTSPFIDFGLGTNATYLNISRNWIYANVTLNDTFFAYVNYSLYNSSGLANQTSYLTTVSTMNWTNLADGRYYYVVNVTDKAGNTNSTEIRYITLDTNATVATPNTPANDSYKSNATQNLTVNLTDTLGIKNATLYVYNSSGDEFNTTTTNFASSVYQITLGTVVNLVQDFYTWFYKVFDWAGTETLSENRTIRTDTTKPLITFNFPASWANYSARVFNVSLRINETYYYYTNISIYNISGNIVNTTSNWTNGTSGNSTIDASFTVPHDGIFTINATTYDNATNSNTTSRNITVDTVTPYLTIRSPINGSVYYINQSIVIDFNATDSFPESRWYNYNGTSSFTNYTYNNTVNINFNESDATLKNITFYANDSAGHLNTTVIYFNVTTLAASNYVLNSTKYNVTENITGSIVVPYNSSIQNITLANASKTVSLDLSQLKIYNNLTATIGANNISLITINGSYNHTVFIPSGINITSNSTWNGKINLPTVNSSIASFTAPSSGTTNIVIDTGSTVELNFSSPVKIIIGGMTGKRAAWARGTGSLTDISMVCNDITNPTLNTSIRECYGDSGTDLVIWTLHFTTFVAYTAYVAPAAESSGSTSGTTGSTSATYTIKDSELIAGYSKELMKGDRVKFTLNNTSYTATLTSLSNSEVKLNLSGTVKTIAIGKEDKSDLNSDGTYDLSIKYALYSNVSKRAKLTFKKISEAVTKPVEPTEPGTTEPSPGTTPDTEPEPIIPVKKASSSIIIMIVILIVAAIIIIGIFLYLSYRNKTKKRHKWLASMPSY